LRSRDELSQYRPSRVANETLVAAVLLALFATAFLGERPTLRDWVGIGLVGMGGLLLSRKR